MKYYFVGLKGAGLSALAVIFKRRGHEVVGYDDDKQRQFTESKLEKEGIKVYVEPNDEMTKDSIVIRSSAIRDDHPEIVKAKKMKLKIYEYNEALGDLSRDFNSITVSGCHGKTTTTSMLATVLNDTLGINYLIGDGTGHYSNKNTTFLFEACEYRRHFLRYRPDYAVITNIDLDHTDYYKDIEDMKDAYEEYANLAKKYVVAWGDDKYIHDLVIKKPVMFYGLGTKNDVVAKNINYTHRGIDFDVEIHGKKFGSFKFPFFGEHNLQNALAVITVCYLLGIDADTINKELIKFKGASRRFTETILSDNVVIDDYAHHPKEVEVTIQAARQKYPHKKIVAILEPHSYTRVKDLHQEFADALNLADYSYVLPIYASRDNPNDFKDISAEMILKDVKNGEIITNKTSNKLFHYEDTVFLFMSLKEIHKIKEDLLNYLLEK